MWNTIKQFISDNGGMILFSIAFLGGIAAMLITSFFPSILNILK